jgi:solute carrier family 25 citrate transporter 1
MGYEVLRNHFADEHGRMSAMQTLACGLGAGVAEAIIAVTPMDTIKTRLIHDQLTRAPGERRYNGFLHGVRTIVREQGLGGVYRGLNATIVKQGSNQAIRWYVIAHVKDFLARRNGVSVDKLSQHHTIIATLSASVASVYGNTPVDVIKTRMQGLNAAKYGGFFATAGQIWREEGFTAFYKGATARLARVSLDVTVVMLLYEQITKALDKAWPTDAAKQAAKRE